MTQSEIIKKAEIHIKQGQLDEAINICKIALKNNEDLGDAYRLMGIVMQLKGNYQQAENYYQQVLLLQPNQAEIYANLGIIYAEKRKWKSATDYYQMAIKINPNNTRFYRDLANIFTTTNQTELANECQYQILIREPDKIKPEDQFNLGNKFLDNGKIDQAIVCYRYAIEFNPTFYHPYCQLGLALSQKAHFKEAILAYQKAIELNPDFSWSYQGLGENLSKLQRFEEAILAYQKAIELNPDFSWSYQGLGENLSKLQRFEEAILAYQKAIELNPDFSWSYYGLGEAYQSVKQEKKAVSTYRHFITINPNIAAAYFNLGIVLKELKQWEEVYIAFSNCLNINPDYPDLNSNLVEVHSNLGNWEEAISYLLQWLKRHTDDFDSYVKLGLILEKMGRKLDGDGCKYLQIIPFDVLKKHLNLSPNLLINIQDHPLAQKISIYPQSLVIFNPPNGILGEPNFRLFPNSMVSPEAFVAVIPNGRVWGDALTSAVMTSEHQLIKDLSTGCSELVISREQLPEPLELEGNVAFLSAQFGLIYYHWMFDIIARLHLLEKADFDFNKIDWFVVNRHQSPYEKEMLKLLNIPEHKVIDNCIYPHVKGSVLLVPSFVQWSYLKSSAWGVNFIRNKFLFPGINANNYPQRIYISRENANCRKVINESEFLPFLETLGFQTVCLEHLPFQEQVGYFANAEIIIAPHGSGLTNLIFCRPKTKVIEFLFPQWETSYYWQLCNIVSCEYYCCVGEPVDEVELNSIPIFDNIKVKSYNIIKLLKMAKVIE
ncbi:UDP-N-acetylglucosamine--peptide N-acetylglucosaminyltransferase 110 kDa subunit [Planktothrix tepida]|uniref:Putative TPR repeat protein n=1 Tax=Planktothrix tepida PCC 9214 TaxID=671072 RepID=A0A1J1LQF7_9CYAN|nr:tetratricopeptide repeat protein [Planktothrix tepida]CAD5962300.1 UDP-N-acetylglucosamine--peptide N-acetylglucosaminyltransferase 110 kDa subunit [Planktothrix tepida]CUR34813.1 putative TPR repeat protein [Planktothrix tepida PCC 9214]